VPSETKRYLCDVCIPTYNEKGFIERTLKNLTTQNIYRKDMVHIVIGDYKDALNEDDDYLINLCKKYTHITYLPIYAKGISKARNMMIAEATLSPIIVNFDADAVFDNQTGLEQMIHPILNKEYKLTNCECILYDFEKNKKIDKPVQNLYEFAANLGSALERYVFARGPGLTVDKEAFWKVGGFRDIDVGEDYLLSTDICMEYSIHAKKFITGTKVLASDRRAKAFDRHGFTAVDYKNSYYR
jgi:glycosyltransferase involved in cell wall biosynthesis